MSQTSPTVKTKYSVISNDVRRHFLEKVLVKHFSIQKVFILKLTLFGLFFILINFKASKEAGLKISTAKAILRIFRTEGRIGKKKHREESFNFKKHYKILKGRMEMKQNQPQIDKTSQSDVSPGNYSNSNNFDKT